MICASQIDNGSIEMGWKFMLITYKCVVPALILNYFFKLRLALFLNFEEKRAWCSHKMVLCKKKKVGPNTYVVSTPIFFHAFWTSFNNSQDIIQSNAL